jgi:aromatic-L-amino-acid/L-tryptophan decarboxylase
MTNWLFNQEALADPLSMSPAEMRTLGYQVVDLAIELMTEPGPVIRRADPETVMGLFDEAAPAAPAAFDELEPRLREILAFRARVDDPAYLAFIPGSGTWPGALADLLASALNIDTCWWLGSAGPNAMELAVLDWFRSWIGMPETAGGILVSGGSAANITALACAREIRVGGMRDDLVLYASDQSHSSNARAARLLGFQPHQVRVVPCDRNLRLEPGTLRRIVAADRAEGRRPLAVLANGGTTATGAVDPLTDLAALCAEEAMWLHVDAAYGAFAVLDPRGRAALAGIEQADSVTLDPHKWLFQPFECAALLVRDSSHLERAFAIAPPYMRDAAADMLEVNFCDRGLQLTRGFRALKIWLSLRYFGLDAFRAAIGRALDVAADAADRIERSQALELLAPPSLGMVAFRRVGSGLSEPELDRANAALVAALGESGDAFVSSVRVHGRYAVRICVLNHGTAAQHVSRVLDYFESAPIPAAPADWPIGDRNPPLERSWATRAAIDADAIRSIQVFDGVTDDQAAVLLAGCRELMLTAGDQVTAEWASDRELYGVLDGIVRVRRGDADVAMLPPGSHFGEIAALGWGAGYTYSRTATTEAVTAVRLVAFDPAVVADVMRLAPVIADRLERSAAERRRRNTEG